MQSRQVSNFKINKMTKAQYSGIVPSQDEVYITTDEADAVLSVNGVLPNAQGNVALSVADTTLSNVTSIDAGSAVQTALNNKADKDLSNLTETGQKVIDGQWVASALTLASGVSYPTTTDTEYSLSTYLPNDNYNYDVLFSAFVTTGSSAVNLVAVRLRTDIINGGDIFISNTITRANLANYNSGAAIVPVGTGRKIIVKAANNYTGTYSIFLRGYRRIGTNS